MHFALHSHCITSSAMQCNALQCYLWQCTAKMQCNAVRCGAMRCIVVQCGALWCNAVRCGASWCNAVTMHCNAAMQCNTVINAMLSYAMPKAIFKDAMQMKYSSYVKAIKNRPLIRKSKTCIIDQSVSAIALHCHPWSVLSLSNDQFPQRHSTLFITSWCLVLKGATISLVTSKTNDRNGKKISSVWGRQSLR